MYFFLFDDASLRSYLAPYTYRRRKPSTYGTFKKDVIRYATKGNYKIHDYNTHEFHRILIDSNLKHLCAAHFLELNTYQDAVWAKLNFENIMNPNKGTQMLGLYGPVDLEPMKAAYADFVEARKQHSEYSSARYLLDSLYKNVNSYQTQSNNANNAHRQHLINEAVKAGVLSLSVSLQGNMKELNNLMDRERYKMAAAQGVLKAYVEKITMA